MLELNIISPAGTIFAGEVLRAVFPGEIGAFEVLPMHAPLISTLVKGDIVCHKPNGEEERIPILSGFVEIKSDHITACIEKEWVKK